MAETLGGTAFGLIGLGRRLLRKSQSLTSARIARAGGERGAGPMLLPSPGHGGRKPPTTGRPILAPRGAGSAPARRSARGRARPPGHAIALEVDGVAPPSRFQRRSPVLSVRRPREKRDHAHRLSTRRASQRLHSHRTRSSQLRSERLVTPAALCPAPQKRGGRRAARERVDRLQLPSPGAMAGALRTTPRNRGQAGGGHAPRAGGR